MLGVPSEARRTIEGLQRVGGADEWWGAK